MRSISLPPFDYKFVYYLCLTISSLFCVSIQKGTESERKRNSDETFETLSSVPHIKCRDVDRVNRLFHSRP